MSFQLSIITPSGKVFEDTIESVAAPGLLGRFEVLSGHAAMVVALKQGDLRVRKNASDQIFKTESGVLEVQPDHNVLVLVDSAEPK